MTPKIKEEWDRHLSKWARKWLVSMYGRKLILKKDDIQNSGLRRCIRNLPLRERDIEVLLYDVHLVEAAEQGLKIVISKDNTARVLFDQVADTFYNLKRIWWACPDTQLEFVLGYLEGQIQCPDLFLGSPPLSHGQSHRNRRE